MPVKKALLLQFALLFFAACASTNHPANDPGFAEARSLADFEGCYENCSEAPVGAVSVCLSGKIWPGEFAPESRPDEIYVQAGSEGVLVISALKHGKKIKDSSFRDGVDFSFKDGRIELRREYLASGAAEPGNVFIGLATAKTLLGLDAEGGGRIQQSLSAAGTAFLIIPVAVSGTDTGKIRRKGAVCNGSGQVSAGDTK